VSEHHRRQSREGSRRAAAAALLVVTLETIRGDVVGVGGKLLVAAEGIERALMLRAPGVGDTLEEEQREDTRLEIRRIDRTA
jgi:hypothetical protein